jgi:hypothetical protein
MMSLTRLLAILDAYRSTVTVDVASPPRSARHPQTFRRERGEPADGPDPPARLLLKAFQPTPAVRAWSSDRSSVCSGFLHLLASSRGLRVRLPCCFVVGFCSDSGRNLLARVSGYIIHLFPIHQKMQCSFTMYMSRLQVFPLDGYSCLLH